jgi:ERF superfamily protein
MQTLNSVMEACSEALINAGIWVTQYPVPVDGDGAQLGLVTKLVHAESGEWQKSLYLSRKGELDCLKSLDCLRSLEDILTRLPTLLFFELMIEPPQVIYDFPV